MRSHPQWKHPRCRFAAIVAIMGLAALFALASGILIGPAGGGTAIADDGVLPALQTDDAMKPIAGGPGYTHAVTREVVRTPGGVVYIFAGDDTAQRHETGPGVIRAWKANRAGIPTAFAEMDGAHRPSGPGGTTKVVGSPDVRLDRAGVVHLIYTREDDASLVYQTFSTATDTWGRAEVVAQNVDVPYNSDFHHRETTGAMVLGGDDQPQITWATNGVVMFRERSGGSWSTPVAISDAAPERARHAQLARDADGALHASWLQEDTDLSASVHYATRPAGGAWKSPEVVAGSGVLDNSTEDQGPSIVVTSSGTPYVLYVAGPRGGGLCCDDGVRVRHRTPAGWVADNPSRNVYTHAPQIYSRGNDIYVFLGHDVDIDLAYLTLPAGGTWSETRKLSDGITADGSASVRWDPQRETDSRVIDSLFFDEDIHDDRSFISRLYYVAVLPDGADETPPGDPDPEPTPPPGGGAEGLVAAYGFDEGQGNVAGDASGLGNDGRVEGPAWSRDGRHGGALSFDGTNDWVSVADAGSLDLTRGMTLEAWVRPSALGANWRTVLFKERPGNLSYGLYANRETGVPDAQVYAGGAHEADAAGGLTSGQWAHLAATYDGNLLRLYVNGKQAVQVAVGDPIETSGGVLHIGGNAIWNEWFAGLIDDVRIYNRALDATQINTDMTLAVGVPEPPPGGGAEGLVAAYGFDEGQGNVAGDASGIGNDGRVEGPAWSRDGRHGGALSFDGTNDWVSVADGGSLDLTQGMTLEAWVRPSALGANWRTVLFKERPGNLSYGLYANRETGVPDAQVYGGGAHEADAAGGLPSGQWAHLAATYDGNLLRLYVNGKQAAQVDVGAPIETSGGVLHIGGNAIWNEWFAGLIDDVRIYNRALDATQINTDMTLAVGVPEPPPGGGAEGLVAAYGFDEGQGNVAGDASGIGNDGRVEGPAWSRDGRHGGALSFDGTNDWVSVADGGSLDLTQGMTLEAWVRPSALGANWRTVLFKERPGNLSYGLYANRETGVPDAQVYGGGAHEADAAGGLPSGQWAHLAATYDGNLLRLYVNGKQAAQVDVGAPIETSGGVLHIGGNAIWNEWFAGLIDDVRIYNRALDATQINTDMTLAVQ